MFCPNCGAQNEAGVQFCRSCGANLSPEGPGRPGAMGGPGGAGGYGAPHDDGRVGFLGVIFFCFPIVGLIMYFVWKGEKPLKAKKACNLALIGVVVGFVLQILATLAGGLSS